MIKQEPQEIDTNIPHRRRGNAFDTLANVFRNVKELVFQNGVTMRNRPGEAADVDVENVFELLANKPAASGKLNYFFFGRRGIADANGDEKRNINYQEITSNHDSNLPDTAGNGKVITKVSVDGVENDASLAIFHGSTAQSGATGIRASMIGVGDATTNDIGGSQMVYVNTTTNAVNGISVDKEGTQMIGLPTSSSGLATGTVWNDGGTLKIVT
jgi:hypothetical protein